MSRIAKKPVELVSGVSVDIKDQTITVKGPKGSASMEVHSDVDVKEENGALVFLQKMIRQCR